MEESLENSKHLPDAELNDALNAERNGEFELELQAALRPCSAPDGFVGRVLARIDEKTGAPARVAVAQEKTPRRAALPFSIRRPGLRFILRSAIAAVLLLAVTLGGYFKHQRAENTAGEHARQQVLLALRITSSTLHAVRNKVDRDTSNNDSTN